MENQTPNTSAVTSTATESTNTNPYASGVLTSEIDKAWRQGKEPEPPKKKEAAPSDPSKETNSEGKPKSATATETVKDGKQEERRAPGAEHRIGELTAEKKAAIDRAEKAERELAELRAGKQTPTEPAKPQAAVASDDPEPQEPKWEDFANKPYGEYEAALRKHYRDLAAWSTRQELRKTEQGKANEERTKVLNAQVEEARKAYPDWNEKGLPALKAIYGDGVSDSPATKAAAHPAIQSALGRSPVMTHLLYVLGKESIADFVALSKRDPIAALRELHLKEFLLIPELAKAQEEAKKANSGKKEDPPAKTKTEESQEIKPPVKPNHEVGNRGTGPDDVAADAVRRGDFHTAEQEWTRRRAQKMGLV